MTQFRQAKDRVRSRTPKDRGFPGGGDTPEDLLRTEFNCDRPDEIVLAHRNAPRRDEHVSVEAVGDGVMVSPSVITTTGRSSTSALARARTAAIIARFDS